MNAPARISDNHIVLGLLEDIAALRARLGYEPIHERVLLDVAIDTGLRRYLRELEQEASWLGASNRTQAA